MPPPPPPEPAPEPTLPYDLLEEIFLRLPPDEPELLVRASLASKLWLGRLTSPLFHARYSELHRSPPMLGFLYNSDLDDFSEEPPLVSTTKFRACIPSPENTCYEYNAWDCRHGRVLLGSNDVTSHSQMLLIWDPITGCRTELDSPVYDYHDCYAAAVFCSVNGCDHRACHAGSSRVVFIDIDMDHDGFVMYAYESLLEAGESSRPHSHLHQWSKSCSGVHPGGIASFGLVTPVLIQDSLYFKLPCDDDHMGILKYDLCSKSLSVIDAPLEGKGIPYITILMGMEDGSLGFAHLDGLTLNLWSRQIGSDGVGPWSECRVIDLKEFLPMPVKRLILVGSVEGGDIIFVTTELGIYKINLKSLEWKKIWKKEDFRTIVPYMSFYYPKERANPYVVAH